MADIQQNRSDYSGSEATVTEAIPYLKYIKNPKHAWNSYVILGINYLNTYDYKTALLYYNKALALKTTEWRKAAAKNNIAFIYMQQQKYKEAIQIFQALLKTDGVKKFPEDYARALDNIGYCYMQEKDSKALFYLTEALKIRTQIKDDLGMGSSYYHLAEFYQDSDIRLSKKYMILSYKKSTLNNHVDDRLMSLKLLINTSKDQELKKYSLLFIKINDSITEVRQKAKNQFAKIRYDSKKERDENFKLKTHKTENDLQLERQKNRNIISYIIIALSLSLILVIYFYLTSRGTKEKIEATYESETRISKKLHDELANDIYHTMAFAENKNLSLPENKEHLLNNLDAIYSRTRDISKENSPILTDENYVFYLKEMISQFNTPNINIIINDLDSILWNNIERNKKITVYRILQELLVNMKKHSNASLVAISFKTTNKNIIITYADNGKGLNLNNTTFKNGLNNVENRILNIKGEIDIDSTIGKGFKVFIKFPL
ncbi:tetratricopeptide repeat protein [Flavobacterium aquidurense]|uniref:tetratricopeptide repeat-containing sensor histidine kinase n=1 Tax=Flavobacterium aquidurense TaxID=362413 RepID=UPI00285F3AA4|nr:tetratricopeptide repeat protein [Flavobacterium aquidurense]MDR7373002.1 signal transduction histidine kinase [Flavobacterium aquidurense]